MTGEATAVELRGISKRYGHLLVLDNINLTVRQGETLALLGPSGCGKSTTLNIIAGFFQPDEGDVLLAGKVVTHLPSHRRNLGMVFQNYSLFPHMSAFDNVAFGLVVRRRPAAEIRERVMTALKLVKLPDAADRFPAQLSGGQQQRVAVARALVLNPQVLLTDEPFSNLDAALRRDMQIELKRIQSDTAVTMVHVTHDQEEAITLADRVALLSRGKIDQIGDPQTMYEFPQTAFGAEFMGIANVMPGQVVGRTQGTLLVQLNEGGQVAVCTDRPIDVGVSVTVCIREERVKLRPLERGPSDGAPADSIVGEWSLLSGIVDDVIFAGAAYKIFIRCQGAPLMRAQLPVSQESGLPPAPGTLVQLCLSRNDLRLVSNRPTSPVEDMHVESQ